MSQARFDAVPVFQICLDCMTRHLERYIYNFFPKVYDTGASSVRFCWSAAAKSIGRRDGRLEALDIDVIR